MDAVDTYFGVLQSMFIVGLSIAMPLFANAVHTQVTTVALPCGCLRRASHGDMRCIKPPFRLVGIGLAVWCGSAVLAGLARYANSYTVLAIARIISGVGEASFQACASARAPRDPWRRI